jgi:hypothetical protein
MHIHPEIRFFKEKKEIAFHEEIKSIHEAT